MTLSFLRTPEEDAMAAEQPGAETIFFVLQRSNGHWSPGARVIRVFATRAIAEMFAAEEKRKHPQAAFGVASLVSEARNVAEPVEIVRMEKS